MQGSSVKRKSLRDDDDESCETMSKWGKKHMWISQVKSCNVHRDTSTTTLIYDDNENSQEKTRQKLHFQLKNHYYYYIK